MGKRSAVKSSRSIGSRTPLVVGILVVGVLAIVIGSTLFSKGDDADASGGSSTTGPIPITRAAVQFPAKVDGGVVTVGPAGKKAPPHTLDVYEDALCPACQALESRGGARLAKAAADGSMRIRYHLLNMLDQRSQPAGYSTLGGNAMMCAAENGIFPDMHVSLYTAQPDEGGTAWTADQIVDLGKRLGAGPGFEPCVRSGAHAKDIAANFGQAAHDPKLVRQGSSGFGTPTLVLDGALLQPGDTRLDKLVSDTP
ncbi:DsbA family protein [Actinomycetospora endophytica]|uniref:DsbA family protein n=1 Tax=Actinomycetospora endophytica TaxID=2291215 RepID=A0ABS8P1U3_9PSEU|nr:thioredoxin domain-containing protein [Actinomycetospora endophytica]MCD2192198.1 DsbA family protein [Actinomycetospora endophytica]